MRGLKAFVHGLAAMGVSGTALYAQQPLLPNFHHKSPGQAEPVMPPIPCIQSLVTPAPGQIPPSMSLIPCPPGTTSPAPGMPAPAVPNGTNPPAVPNGSNPPAIPNGTNPPVPGNNATPTPTPPAPNTGAAPGAGNGPGFDYNNAVASASSAGTGGSGSRISMFGDAFGGRVSTLSFRSSTQSMMTGPGVTNGLTAQVVVFSPGIAGNTQRQIDPNSNNQAQTPRFGFSQQGNFIFVPGINTLQPYVENSAPVGQRFTPTNFSFINPALAFISRPPTAGVPNPFGPTAEFARGFLYNQVAAMERAANPAARLTSLELGPITAQYETFTDPAQLLNYYTDLATTITTPVSNTAPIFINIPNPSAGGVVGRTKISEDNNPIPRDRVMFNYDYFSHTTLTAGGANVNRYNFGVEKTFLDGLGSVEFRVPFAATLNSNIVAGSESTRTELGNVRAALKVMPILTDTYGVSGGVAVNFATANDVNVSMADGTRLLQIRNQATTFEPFLATIITPTEKLFMQAWASLAFDPTGNPVATNASVFGVGNLGHLHDSTILALDAQVGYWIYQSDTSLLSGVAPFLELHYNSTVSNGSVLSNGNGLLLGDTSGNLDEFNLSVGVATLLSNNLNLNLGATLPLRGSPNRTFEYQIGLRLNWFYGASAKPANSASRVSGF